MSRKIALVACVSQKVSSPHPARALYISAWFRKASAYAQCIADRWFVLSAKYGLVPADKVIAPYDKTLNHMVAEERRAWAEQVLDALATVVGPGDQVVILAGRRYREYLVDPLREMGCEVEVPMKGLGIGQQLQWLNEHHKEEDCE